MTTTPPRSYLRYTTTVHRGRLLALCAEQVPIVSPGKTVELATRVLADLFEPQPDNATAALSPAIRCRLPKIVVDGIGIAHRKDFAHAGPVLRLTPRIRLLDDDRHTRITTAPGVDIPVPPAARDTYVNPAEQIAALMALVDEILDAACASLNAAADVYARAFTWPEPDTVELPARRLDDNCTLVGMNGGHSAVLDNQGPGTDGRIHLVTEHGVLHLDPEELISVLDEYGIPPVEPEMCHHLTYRATPTTPAEYCDNEALPGSDYCADHEDT